MNLDTLKTEIEAFLEAQGFAVFHGYSRMLDTLPIVYWDCDRHPDYKEFVKSAKAAGARVMVLHQRELVAEQINDALEELESLEMPRNEHRGFERRLKDLRKYEGLTCALELSFDHEGRVFLFDLSTEWYEELSEILGELQLLAPEEDEEDDSMGGYFSKN